MIETILISYGGWYFILMVPALIAAFIVGGIYDDGDATVAFAAMAVLWPPVVFCGLLYGLFAMPWQVGRWIGRKLEHAEMRRQGMTVEKEVTVKGKVRVDG